MVKTKDSDFLTAKRRMFTPHLGETSGPCRHGPQREGEIGVKISCVGENGEELSGEQVRACLWCGGGMEGKKASALACSTACNHARLAARRKAEKWAGVDVSRACEKCGASMIGKRPHARFCSRTCKAAAAQVKYRTAGILKKRDRARYDREGVKRREYAKQYLQANPERMRAIRLRRKGRIKANSFRFTEKDWQRLVTRYRGCCAYCGEHSGALQREHVVPLGRGGTHGVGNILPACPSCNYAKKDKLLVEWRLKRARIGSS